MSALDAGWPPTPAREMSNEAIQDDMERHCRLWDERSADKEGHSGSPGEWMVERMDELRTEAKRRGIVLTEPSRPPR